MNIKQLKEALPLLLKHNVVPFIWGHQGVGKTQSIAQVAKASKVGFRHLHLATQEVGDLVGLLVHNKDGTVKHARPEWFPTSGEGIVFLDELNRAHPDVIQAMFSFITSKTIHSHKLPDGWKIVAAGNYSTDEFNVTDTSDQAWMSRFCHINLQPTAQEFVVYAEGRGHITISDFIAEHENCLESANRKMPDLAITPDRRAWVEMVGPLENEDIDEATRFELYAGIVGQAAASSFMSFKKSQEKKLRLRDITRNYKAVRSRVKELTKGKETRFDALSAPLDELTTRLTSSDFVLDEDSIVNLKAYLLDVPLELVCQLCKKLGKMEFRGKDSLLNDPVFNEELFGKQ